MLIDYENRYKGKCMAIQLEIAWGEFMLAQEQTVMLGHEYAAIEKLGQAWSRHQQEQLGAFVDGAQFNPSPLEKDVLQALGKTARQERLDRKASYARPMTPEEDKADLEMMEQLYRDHWK